MYIWEFSGEGKQVKGLGILVRVNAIDEESAYIKAYKVSGFQVLTLRAILETSFYPEEQIRMMIKQIFEESKELLKEQDGHS
jgi:hypothetical protein